MNKKLDSLSKKLETKRKQLQILQEEVSDLYQKFKAEKEKQWLIDNVELSIEEALAYEYTETGYKQKKERIALTGLESSGYYSDTQQYAPRIRMYKNSKESFEKTLKGLKEVLPYLKVRPKCEHKAKHVQIFEHTLSKCGIYTLLAFDENSPFPFALEKTVYSHPKIEKEFSSLEEAVSYIQEHHYYEDVAAKNRYDDSEEDDDGGY